MVDELLNRLLPGGFAAESHSFVIRFTSNGELKSEGAASAIRDGLGRGLKRLSTCTNEPDCTCAYCSYFKPQTPPGTAGSISPGFVLALTQFPRKMEIDATAKINLVLFGRAQQAFVWFLAAMLHCGQIGIGSPRAKFTVDVAGPPIAITPADIINQSKLLLGIRECRIEFLSPCIIEDGGNRRDSIDFSRLIKAIIERLQPNIGFWCDHMIRNKDRDAAVASLIARASEVESDFSLDEWVHETSHKYNRKSGSLSGFKGSLDVRGDLDLFWPFLLLGSVVHVGLRSNLDRGRYRLILR
jgi:hypothetical protein